MGTMDKAQDDMSDMNMSEEMKKKLEDKKLRTPGRKTDEQRMPDTKATDTDTTMM